MSRLETSACKSPRISITTDDRQFFHVSSDNHIVAKSKNTTHIGFSPISENQLSDSSNESEMEQTFSENLSKRRAASARSSYQGPNPTVRDRSDSHFSMSSMRQSFVRARQLWGQKKERDWFQSLKLSVIVRNNLFFENGHRKNRK